MTKITNEMIKDALRDYEIKRDNVGYPTELKTEKTIEQQNEEFASAEARLLGLTLEQYKKLTFLEPYELECGCYLRILGDRSIDQMTCEMHVGNIYAAHRAHSKP